MATHFLNGKFVSEEDLLISPRDLGFTRGYAVFDFLKTYPHHRLFKIDEHVDRLLKSAEAIGLAVEWRREQVKVWIIETLDKNDSQDEKFIKIMISGGVSHAMTPKTEPTIIITVDPAVRYPEQYYTDGIGITTVRFGRYIPHAKSNNYIEGVRQTQLAEQIGAVEPLYYSDEQVFEGSNSNVFAVIDNVLVTPKSNLLEGVTRGVLLDILKLNIPIEVRDFTLDEFMKASEAFLSASGKEILPITAIDGKKFGGGVVGPITKEIMKQYKAYTASDLW